MTDETQRDDGRYPVNRRRMLLGMTTTATAGLAGCTGDGSDTQTEMDETDMGDGTAEMTDSATPPAKQGGTLTIAQAKSPIEFDPVVLNDVPSAEIASRVFEGLYTYNEATKVVPELAAEMPTVENDGTRYTVPLKEGPTFSNGDPVTAEDVAYSFTAPVDEETENAAELNMIETVEAVDDRTVRFDLKFPFGPFMHTLTRSVVPKSVREQDREAFRTEPVGSGPFTFEEFQEGELATISARDDYWGEPQPLVDGVEFRPVEEPTTRLTTLQNAKNLVVKGVPPKLYNTIEGMSEAQVQEQASISYFYLAMNCKEGPTANKTVREAVDYTFSMDEAVADYVEPAGARQYSPIPQSVAESWDFPVDQWKQVPHDKNIDKAQQLFDEAGVSTDYSWKIIVPPDNKREQIGIQVGNGLQQAGFENVSVQRLDWDAFLDQYVTGAEADYNMFTLGWSGLPDPNSFMYPLFARAEDALGVTNGCYYGANSEAGKTASDKIVQARESADREQRRQLYVDAISTVLEDRAHIPAYSLKSSFGVRNKVKDFLPHAVDQFHLSTSHNNVYLDDG